MGERATKAAVFDETGRELSTAGMDTAMIVPKAGFTERDMDEMWEANCLCVRRALEKAGISGEEITCVAVCGHGKGLYLWGKDGRPVRNGIISTYNRAGDIRKNGRRIDRGQSFSEILSARIEQSAGSLLAWLKEHEPETLDKTEWIFACKDYIRFRLTGEAFAERTDYTGCNFVNLYTGE